MSGERPTGAGRAAGARGWSVIAAVSAGGALGATARVALTRAFPHVDTGFPWSTLTINVTGSLLIGVVMVVADRRWERRPLLRPFVGTGVLGGFTTFSGYVGDAQLALAVGAVPVALGYLAATLVAALFAAWAGAAATARLLDRPAR